MQTEVGGRVTHLFLVHPTSIRLTRRYENVLILECTYKLNRFKKMPLLTTVGRTGVKSLFLFVFLSGEDKGDYVQALQKLRDMLGFETFLSPTTTWLLLAPSNDYSQSTLIY